MKLNDKVSGLLILIFGMAVVAQARTFPSMPGQSIGPSLFPTLIGGGLMVCGAALVLSRSGRGAPWFQADDWVRRPRMVLNFGLVFVDLVFYAIVVGRLGFFITAVIFLSVLMLAFGVSRPRIVPLALGVTIVIHYAFYSLLRVPLPWGVLEGIAW
jgi:putative tricarboxylic transport membrane protein